MGSVNKNYEPRGIKFYDGASKRWMILVGTDEPRSSLHGWLVYQHPEGQWVTLRKASDEDIAVVAKARSEAFHAEDEE